MTENALEKHDMDLRAWGKDGSIIKASIVGALTATILVVIFTAFAYYFHMTLKIFTVLFGVVTGVMVKHIGKGSANKYGTIAGGFAFAGVLFYSLVLANYFVSDAQTIADKFPTNTYGQKDMLNNAFIFREILWGIVAAVVSFAIGYRIGKNPMKKDELDYLLEAKGIDSENEKYSKRYFKRKR